ncbi:hypothetical protein ACFV0R_23150 [Streptomyces sp. NPDC059578]|uniref:hypothetical protein n=1 Tax=unclassified Streptomyces TaxID=2593676 RepID=UPI003660AF2C
MNPGTPEAPAVGAVVFDPTKGAVGRVIGLHDDLAMLQRPGGRPWASFAATLRPADTLQRARHESIAYRYGRRVPGRGY